MNGDQKLWLGIWGLVGATLIALAATLGIAVVEIRKSAFEQGYEQRMAPGNQGPIWVQVDK